MKRELKERLRGRFGYPADDVTKPIPMKRELKVSQMPSSAMSISDVTKPIPMKRELKAYGQKRLTWANLKGHKANPDEKGTESGWPELGVFCCGPRHKANPDEKGTERLVIDLRILFRIFVSQSQSR